MHFKINNLFLIIIIILIHFNIILAQDIPYIADFYNNKDGAISITFDDASYGQFEYGFPILQKYKFKASFGIIGDWIKDTPTYFSEDNFIFYKRLSKKELYILYSEGHEISWHGMKHIPYNSELKWYRLEKQMKKEKEFIKLYLPQIKINTIQYPYSKTKGKIILAAESSGYLFGRTGNEKYNKINSINYYLLNSFAIYNDTTPNIFEFIKIIDNTKGKWCILMYHHIITDTSVQNKIYNKYKIEDNYSVSPQTFNEQMKYISKQNYWVATIYDVGRYIKQKEHSNIKLEIKNGETFLTVECNLDENIYNHELTVIYKGKNYNIKPNTKIKL